MPEDPTAQHPAEGDLASMAVDAADRPADVLLAGQRADVTTVFTLQDHALLGLRARQIAENPDDLATFVDKMESLYPGTRHRLTHGEEKDPNDHLRLDTLQSAGVYHLLLEMVPNVATPDDSSTAFFCDRERIDDLAARLASSFPIKSDAPTAGATLTVRAADIVLIEILATTIWGAMTDYDIELQLALDEFTIGHPYFMEVLPEGREAEKIDVDALAADMGKRLETSPAGTQHKDHFVAALRIAADHYNHLAAADSDRIMDPRFQPILDEMRDILGADWIHQVDYRAFDELRLRVESIMYSGILGHGVDYVMDEHHRRGEGFAENLNELLEFMVELFNKIAPQSDLFNGRVEAARNEHHRKYMDLKSSLMWVVAGSEDADEMAATEGGLNARQSLLAQLRTMQLDLPHTPEEVVALMDDLVAHFKHIESISPSTSEELCDHIVENILMHEIDDLLAKKVDEPSKVEIQTILGKFYTLFHYHLKHLKNSLAAQNVRGLRKLPEVKTSDDVIVRSMDVKPDRSESTDDEYKLEVTTELLVILSRSIRAFKTILYLQAFIGSGKRPPTEV